MSLRDLAGQSLMLSIEGQRLTPAIADLLARTRACGVVLFARNVAGPAQLSALCAALQAEAARLGLPPLLIAMDQEGGTVSRLPAPFVVPPSQQAQAATGDPEAAYAAARISGAQLRACGVNVNFAPVLDVSLNPANPVIGIRGFGADPATVSAFGLAALRGYRDTGVIATVKHFPGHGDTSVDSHHGLPVVPHGRARLDAVELAPFRAAFAAGAPAVMAAHIVFPALDERPATLSPAILRGLLREQLGYDGLVFTDALDMGAIAERYGAPEACVLARAAGADVLLPLGDAANQIAAADALVAALEAGRLALDDFIATADRLVKLRKAYGVGDEGRRTKEERPPTADDRRQTTDHRPPTGSRPSSVVRRPSAELAEAEQEALELARRGLTRRDPRGLLPLPADARLAAIDCLLPRFNDAEEAASRAELLRGLLAAAFPRLDHRALMPDAPEAAWRQAIEAAGRADAVLIVTRNAWLVERQAALGAALAGAGAPLIHLAARSPRDGELLPGAAATLLSYGDPPLSLRAAVEALGGRP
jgi:beta-N-acetylhexosaminidase